jgi:hypothetical protein
VGESRWIKTNPSALEHLEASGELQGEPGVSEDPVSHLRKVGHRGKAANSLYSRCHYGKLIFLRDYNKSIFQFSLGNSLSTIFQNIPTTVPNDSCLAMNKSQSLATRNRRQACKTASLFLNNSSPWAWIGKRFYFLKLCFYLCCWKRLHYSICFNWKNHYLSSIVKAA